MRQASTVKKTKVQSPRTKNRVESSLEQTGCAKEDFHQKVQETAYELFLARGSEHGYDVEDWLAAEEIVKAS